MERSRPRQCAHRVFRELHRRQPDRTATVRLLPVTDTGAMFVEWTFRYQSDSDQAVSDFCNPVYAALLGAWESNLA